MMTVKKLSLGTKSKFLLKLALGIITVSVLGLITIFIITNTIVRDSIYDNVIGVAQREQALHAAEIDAWFGTATQTIDVLANVLKAMPADENYAPILERFVQEYYFIDNIFIGFPDGRTINGRGWVPDEGWSLFDRPWYIAAMAAGDNELVTLDAFWSYSGQVVAAALSIWLPDVGEEGVVLGFSITLDNILDRVSRHPVMGDGYLILISADGQIITHPEPYYSLGPDMEVFNLRNYDEAGSYIMRNIGAEIYFSQIEDARIGTSYFLADPLANVNWILITIIPVETTDAIVAGNLTATMISLSVFSLALFAVVMIFTSRLTKSEAESRASLRELEARSRREIAEEKDRAKSRFLSNMSHEIRTPLGAIIGMTGIAKNTDDLDRKSDCIDKIEKASTHLLGIINQILDISKIEAEQFKLDSNTFRFEKMVDEVLSVLSVSVEEKRLALEVDLDKSIPEYIVSDEIRLAQVLTNLLNNAIKFTPEGGKVSLSTKLLPDAVMRVEIADSGIGIPKKHHSDLFDAFVQVEMSATRSFAGTGLGLPISKKIIEMMGGKIWFESENDRGSCFTFEIPIEAGSAEEDSATAISDSDELDLYKDFTVLVVEDMEINYEIISALLEPTGIKIEWAINGAQAVEMFRDNSERYDLILMDVQMPVMDGITATRLIRKQDTSNSKSIPIVAMTANVFKEDINKCLEAGMNNHLSKPLDRPHVSALLRLYLLK